jgi:serine/threonine protein kinase
MDHGVQARRLVAGRYRLIDALGRGGYGCVWRARDERLGVTVAVKEIWLPSGSHVDRAEYLRRAEREARNTARLRNEPHIVPVYDVINDDSTLWMVMRLIEGQSLEQRLESGVLSIGEAKRVARDLLLALRAAHAAGVVHRDLKPANVLLEQGGEVWLTDFGVAVHQQDTSLTATGIVVGSAEYIAPERVDGSDAHPASDLFALGVVLYRALEGFSPFLRSTASDTLIAIMMYEPQPARRAGELTELIAALLCKNPAQRPTAEVALAMLATAGAPAAMATSAVAAHPAGRHSSTRADIPARPPSAPLGAATSQPAASHEPPSGKRGPRTKLALIGAAAAVLAGVTVGLAVTQLHSAGPVALVNLALHKPVIVSSQTDSNGWSAVQATSGNIKPSDGTKDNGWASYGHAGPDATEWIEVSLGAAAPVDEVKLYPRNDTQEPGGCFPSDFTIAVSTNGNAWTTMVADSDYPSPGTKPQVFTFPKSTARYVRVTATALNHDQFGSYYFELKQIEVFGT